MGHIFVYQILMYVQEIIFHFKSRGYTLNYQLMVENCNRFAIANDTSPMFWLESYNS